MDNEVRRVLALAVIVVSLVMAVGMGWRSATIILDNTEPEIIRDATTHGKTAYMDTFTVTCVVEEAVGMDHVDARVLTQTPPSMGGWQETISLTEKSHDRETDRYTYSGSFSHGLMKDLEYNLVYWAQDESGLEQEWKTTVTMVELDGYVKVNGNKITDKDDTVYVRSKNLEIKVYITKGANEVEEVRGTIEDQDIGPFTKKGNALTGYHWDTTYTLPSGEGSYTIAINVESTADDTIRLASFTITLSKQYKIPLIIGAGIILAGITAYGYHKSKQQQEKEG